jgi:hypothetical protein
MCKELVCLVVLVMAVTSAGVLQGAVVAEKLETFDTDPGWKASGNRGGGNDYGYLPGPSHHADGDGRGEIGGAMARSGGLTYYADTNLQGTFDTSAPLRMSGRIAITTPIGDPGSDRIVLGYLNTNTQWPTLLGIRICDPKNGLADWRIRLFSVNSAGNGQGNPQENGAEMTVEGEYSFEWTYDPSLGANGRLTLQIATSTGSIRVGHTATEASQEATITFDLPAGHGKSDTTARFNAFGLGVMNAASNGHAADVYLDDLLYNFIEPGKASDPTPANGAAHHDTWVGLSWKPDPLATSHDVYVGENFEDVYNGTGDTYRGRQAGAAYPVGLPGFAYPEGLVPGTTYYWRIDGINEAHPDSPWKGNVWSFTIPAYTAYAPRPENGDTTVWPGAMLTWQSGMKAAEHRLYFGQDLDLVGNGAAEVDKGILTAATFDPNGLSEGTAYYWRVDKIDVSGAVTAGEVWTFATVIPIEDFEEYIDDMDSGQAIFQTWMDGYSDESSGSQVGYLKAPFAERRVVRSGRQAMPMKYNNADAPWYSEAARTFTPAEDWTAGGTDTLVLWVRGRTGNDQAPLYVTVEDSANRRGTAVHPDDAIVKTGNWVQWQIPFTAFTSAGVNMASVKKLVIGVGDRGIPGPTGTLYIDDIARALSPVTE